MLGWQSLVASGGYLVGNLIQGMLVIANPDYVPDVWRTTLLFWAVVLLAILVNTVIAYALPKIEGIVLILHIIGLFAVLIPMIYWAPHSDASEVFTLFQNTYNWPTQGLSCLIGMLGTAFAFIGRACHLLNPGDNVLIFNRC